MSVDSSGIPLHLDTRSRDNKYKTVGLHVNFWDKAFDNRPQSFTHRIKRDLGGLTGFHTAACRNGNCGATQIGFSEDYGGNAVQVQGNEIGVVLDTNSFLNHNSKLGAWPMKSPMPLMIEYRSEGNDRFRPFTKPGKILNFGVDLQVPTSVTVGDDFNAGHSVGMITLYLSLFDTTTKRSVAYGAHVWDSRPRLFKSNAEAYVKVDVCQPPDTCTGSPMVVAPISSGGLYNRFVPGSSQPIFGRTFKGYRRFVLSISAENLRAMIDEVNVRVRQGGGREISSDPGDYEVRGVSVDSEIAYAGSHARFAYSARNISITLEDAPKPVPFSQLYNRETRQHKWIPQVNALNSVREAVARGFIVTNSIGSIYTNLDRPGLAPLHQFYRAADQNTFFSVNASIESMRSHGFDYDGIIGYVPKQATGRPIRSLYHPNHGHFYTPVDSGYSQKLPQFGYTPEQIRFYLIP